MKNNQVKLNYKQVAETLGVSVSTLYAIISGRIKNPSPEILETLKKLGILCGTIKKSNFSNWLKIKRKRKGISLADLAKLTGIKVSTLSAIETGRIKNPSESVKTALRTILCFKDKTYSEMLINNIDLIIALFILILQQMVSLFCICKNNEEIHYQLLLIPISTIQNSQPN